MAGGNFFAGILSGDVYGAMSDKLTLLQKDVAARGLSIPEISENFTQNDYINKACELMGYSQAELTDYLWTTYHTSNIWFVFAGIGLGTVVILWLYDKLLLRKK